jgi:hypothetical protein
MQVCAGFCNGIILGAILRRQHFGRHIARMSSLFSAFLSSAVCNEQPPQQFGYHCCQISPF